MKPSLQAKLIGISVTMLGIVLALCSSISLASNDNVPLIEKPKTSTEASLSILNREIVHFRTTVLGIEPEERVKRAHRRIEQQLAIPGGHKVSIADMPPGKLIQIDGAGSFYIAPEDIDPFQQETIDSVAKQTLSRLNLVLQESRESRSLEGMLRAGAYVLVATMIFATLLWLTFRLRRTVVAKTLSFARDKLDGHELIEAKLINREHIQSGLRRALQWFSWLVIFLLTYEWLSYSLSQFPFTRPLGEQLNHYLIDLVTKIGSATIKSIPDLFTACIIFFLAKIVMQAFNALFDRIEKGSLEVTWLDADVVTPTRRIVKVAVWLFALTMAYPYLPGSGTEAFKGISVLVGLMISLGASSLIAQAASGLILTYSRIYRKGEFIHVNGIEGTITDLGMFTTRIRNGMGLEITLPNALVLSNVTKNYSRAVVGPGFVIDTKVTIGYDTPWRQVEAMLIEAARRTPSILKEPAPKVFQTALSDFYPEYLLICQAVPAEPVPRASVMSQLHANIQDVFNEYNVQIMSPHYLGDPDKEKLVPKEGWFRAPANAASPTNAANITNGAPEQN
jgi:small-conductance mechanosensitive channel